jgi:uncharacterized OB-fold protein
MAEMTTKAFSDFLGEGKIMGSRCGGCGAIHLPPRPVCPECGRGDAEWIELGGEGVVQAYTVITVPLTRLKDRCPYAVGVVKLDEGPSISGSILGVADGGDIAVGSRVTAEFVKEGERTALCFRPV